MTNIVKVDVIPSTGRPVEGVHYNILAGTPQFGDKVRVTTLGGSVFFESCYTPPAPPAAARPLTLSATGFMDVAIAGLKAANASTQAAAEARFFNILDAARTFTNADAIVQSRVRYAHERYGKATTFNKSVVTVMLELFKSAGVAALTGGEESGILSAWPEA